MKTKCTLQNREGDVLVVISPEAGNYIELISQAVESCYRSDGFDKLLWNTRYVGMLNELKGIAASSYDLNTGEVLS